MHMLVIRTGWSGALRPTFSSYDSSIVFSKYITYILLTMLMQKWVGKGKTLTRMYCSYRKPKKKKNVTKSSLICVFILIRPSYLNFWLYTVILSFLMRIDNFNKIKLILTIVLKNIDITFYVGEKIMIMYLVIVIYCGIIYSMRLRKQLRIVSNI